MLYTAVYELLFVRWIPRYEGVQTVVERCWFNYKVIRHAVRNYTQRCFCYLAIFLIDINGADEIIETPVSRMHHSSTAAKLHLQEWIIYCWTALH